MAGKVATNRPDYLKGVTFKGPSSLALTFADRKFSLAIKRLGMPIDEIRWETAAASPAGNSMTVNAKNGELIPIDASALRYLVDAKYAAKIDKAINDLHMTPAEAEEAARLSRLTRDPRWNDVGDEDDLFE